VLVADAIAFRSEAMIAVALFGLIATHVRRNPWLAGLFMLLGGLSKETALVLGPLFVIALEMTATRKRRSRRCPQVPGEGAQEDGKTGRSLFFSSYLPVFLSPFRRSPRMWLTEGAALAIALGLRILYAPAFRAEAASMPLGQAIGTRLSSLARAAEA